MRPLIEGGPEVTPIMNKSVIVESYLTFLKGHVVKNNGQMEESKHNDDDPPAIENWAEYQNDPVAYEGKIDLNDMLGL